MEDQGQGPSLRPLLGAAIVAGLVYLLVRQGRLGQRDFLILTALVPSIILHEVSHGAAALAFGDDTAKQEGRLTLNPVRHIDPFGTLVLPAVLVLVGAPPFGYAKPVPVRPARLRHPRNHGLLVSLVGPAVNIVLAVAAALVLRSLVPGGEGSVQRELSLLERGVFWLGYANVLLAVFNLIPIPPLDGSAVVERLLPARWWPGYLRIRQYSMLLLLGVVLLGADLLSRIFNPAVELWIGLLP